MVNSVNKFESYIFNLFWRIGFSCNFFVFTEAFFHYFGVENIISNEEDGRVVLGIWVLTSHPFVHKAAALVVVLHYIIKSLIDHILHLFIVVFQILPNEIFKIPAQIEIRTRGAAPAVAKLLEGISDAHSWPEVVGVDDVGEPRYIPHVVLGEDGLAVVLALKDDVDLVFHAALVSGDELDAFEADVERSSPDIKFNLVFQV